jgi:FtsZ-binding cell division protein ZapB
MTNTQKIQSEIDELIEKFNILQSQSATLSELNSVRRELNIAYEKLRKNCDDWISNPATSFSL